MRSSRLLICLLITLSGAATLSWEGLWQIKASLALGMSAPGTAITLAVTMGGMGFGSLLMGYALKHFTARDPLRVYGALEALIGLSGLALGPAFALIEKLDSRIYMISAALAPLTHLASIIAALGVPALCMGATFPVIGLIARKYNMPLTKLYGLNTLGAALGLLLATFILIPLYGITQTGFMIAGVNGLICLIVFVFAAGAPLSAPAPSSLSLPASSLPDSSLPDSSMLAPAMLTKRRASDLSYALDGLCRLSSRLFDGAGGMEARTFGFRARLMMAALSGFVIFALEIAWFRAMTAAFQSTTYAFAIMLACVLVALSQGAHLTPLLKNKNIQLGTLMMGAGILVMLATPLVERLDLFLMSPHSLDNEARMSSTTAMLADSGYMFQITLMMSFLFILTYLVIGPAMILLGVCFPWLILDEHNPRHLGGLYAVNTLAAIGGSVGAWG